ncbi:MAG: hypothetical protein D6736_04690 [Nitrospinota bacterium]|nr:MAG: hypothetical protein D6736_04690 [Nitrospinota bacterium]
MAKDVADDEGKEKKGSWGKVLLLTLNLLLFLAGVGFFLLTKFGLLSTNMLSATAQEGGEPVVEQPVAPKPAVARVRHPDNLVPFSLRPFTVNLNDPKRERYLRINLTADVWGEEAQQDLESRLPEIRNRLIFLLTSKSFTDINTVEGKYQLQEEIKKQINEAVGWDAVKEVYFTEFIVQ